MWVCTGTREYLKQQRVRMCASSAGWLLQHAQHRWAYASSSFFPNVAVTAVPSSSSFSLFVFAFAVCYLNTIRCYGSVCAASVCVCFLFVLSCCARAMLEIVALACCEQLRIHWNVTTLRKLGNNTPNVLVCESAGNTKCHTAQALVCAKCGERSLEIWKVK